MATEDLEKAVKKMAADIGIEISFDADADLSKFRRGERLTMGQLRALPDGAIVWLYIYYKESVRADSAFRIERRDDCWVLDDGSSFGADLDDEGPDDAPAGDEWSEVYEAVKTDG